MGKGLDMTTLEVPVLVVGLAVVETEVAKRANVKCWCCGEQWWFFRLLWAKLPDSR